MRSLTMPAGDLGSVDPSHTGLLGWAGGALAALLGSFGVWLANKTLGKAAFQTAINDGFKKLIDELQEQNQTLRADLAARELTWAAQRASLEGEIRNLNQRIESLTHQLKRHGVDVLELRASPEPDVGATVIGKDRP